MLAAAAAVALVAVMAPAPTGAQTDDDTDTDIVTISDTNFASAIANALNLSPVPLAFTPSELASISRLTAHDKSISDITGISNLTGLTYVDLSDNNLTSADFSSNTKLTTLDVSDNDLTSLTLTGLTKLATLDVSENELTSLPLTGLTKLSTIYAHDNQLNTVALPNVGDNDLAVYLWKNNSLTSVTGQRYDGCESTSQIVDASETYPDGCTWEGGQQPPAYATYFYTWLSSGQWARIYRGNPIGADADTATATVDVGPSVAPVLVGGL